MRVRLRNPLNELQTGSAVRAKITNTHNFDAVIGLFCRYKRIGFAQFTTVKTGMVYARFECMKWQKRLKLGFTILTLYGIGLAEAYYLPHYGIEWMLAAIGATALAAGFWIRTLSDA